MYLARLGELVAFGVDLVDEVLVEVDVDECEFHALFQVAEDVFFGGEREHNPGSVLEPGLDRLFDEDLSDAGLVD